MSRTKKPSPPPVTPAPMLPMHPDMLGALENYLRTDGTVRPIRDRVLRVVEKRGKKVAVDTGPPVSDRNVDAYWECIYFEARYPSDRTGKQPSDSAPLHSRETHARNAGVEAMDLKSGTGSDPVLA